MSTTTTTVENLITTLTEALTEAEKHTNGNNAAGGRLRKTLQTVEILVRTFVRLSRKSVTRVRLAN